MYGHFGGRRLGAGAGAGAAVDDEEDNVDDKDEECGRCRDVDEDWGDGRGVLARELAVDVKGNLSCRGWRDGERAGVRGLVTDTDVREIQVYLLAVR